MRSHSLEPYLAPRWVRYVLGVIYGSATAAILWVVWTALRQPRVPWLSLGLFVTASSPIIVRAFTFGTRVRMVRDERYADRIARFKNLKGAGWHNAICILSADPSLELISESPIVLANPLTWHRRCQFVSVTQEDLQVQLFEFQGRVKAVRIRQISSDD